MIEYAGIDSEFYDAYIFGDIIVDDIPFYVEEAKLSGDPVLELGCGTGRILIPTAEAGVNVTGLDLSKDMLKHARQKINKLEKTVRDRITLIEGDMRNFSIDCKFKLITIPFRAFLHLMTVQEQKSALSCIKRHLTDDGRLIFNIFDPNLEIISSHSGYLGQALKKQVMFKHSRTGNTVIGWDSRTYNLEEQTVDEMRLYEEIDKSGKVVSRHYVPLNLRFLYRYETQHLLELCGFKVDALYGNFERGKFKAGGEQIWVCSKAV